jgi:hypothetical protein
MSMVVLVQNLLSSPVVLALVGYAGLVLMLAVLAQPMRLRMVAIAESILSEPHWNKAQRDEVNSLLDTMDCLKTAIIFPLAVVMSTIVVVFGLELPRDKAIERLAKDDRFHQLAGRYFLSLLAANPLAAVVTIPLIVISAPLCAFFGNKSGTFKDVVEAPVFKASTAVLASYQARLAA